MKFSVVIFVVILLVQLTVAAAKFSLSAYEHQNMEDNKIDVAREALFIPTTVTACLNSTCQAICKALGYKHGICISADTCRCSM